MTDLQVAWSQYAESDSRMYRAGRHKRHQQSLASAYIRLGLRLRLGLEQGNASVIAMTDLQVAWSQYMRGLSSVLRQWMVLKLAVVTLTLKP